MTTTTKRGQANGKGTAERTDKRTQTRTLQSQMVNIKKLKANTGQIPGLPKNPRIIKDEKFTKLVESITADPEMMEMREVLAFPHDGELVVIAGNMRLKACEHLGYKSIPTKILPEHTSIEKLKAYTMKDNIAYGETDWKAIADDWDIEWLAEIGLDIPELAMELREAKEDNYTIPDEIQTDIIEGDLIEIGQHRLICGDSTMKETWERLMGEEQADAVITDPPYNVNYHGGTAKQSIQNDNQEDATFYTFLKDFYTAAAQHTREGGAFYVWHADSEGANFRNAFIDSGLLLKQCLIWVKSSLVMGRQDYHWRHEPCLYGWKPGAAHYFTGDRTNSTVFDDKLDLKKLNKAELLKMLQDMTSEKQKTSVIYCDKPQRNDVHPTMKPVLLIAELMGNSTRPGQLVADGFLGSGTTMVTAEQLGRRCYGMELDPKFCQVIIERMQALKPKISIRVNGKPYQQSKNKAE